ncbi:hypothetical protein RO3G_06386 [Rhizopus delemar RA 99-880]|uniref:Uncharacterized protein n=1 Tax=Rhizopus delemar (strain RA 99-880 / ATCC MYA-4621 / FGSC 9543 / NRRL 43880) TaxID=246409 RepID=I1BZQ1_RHIO9|nr:hypothetical protein RO3G_06386 [Rhizopus delemar RA 99-880]|eukprot:EIE81681.1 hypothetical protein RO3G_06386 [Rhizopus delemar RA 99-880]
MDHLSSSVFIDESGFDINVGLRVLDLYVRIPQNPKEPNHMELKEERQLNPKIIDKAIQTII